MSAFYEFTIPYQELAVDPQAAAPMLGYDSDMPDDILTMVREVVDETADCYDIRGGYMIFDSVAVNKDDCTLSIGGSTFHISKIITRQIKRSTQVAVFICTAGVGIEQWSRKMLADNEPLKGFIADIMGGVVVELAIDRIQQLLGEAMNAAGLKITNRYSPGYCGWHTFEQHHLFSLLPTTLGIRLTESALMQPIKSVSGIIGIGADVRFNPYSCGLCDATQCVYRNKR
ncbi:MAG: hypothetical protein LBN37_01335 [Bacteroidales bacterium]|jgi:hypothetical protein|nr:hypothetical protein [Bacteroidales bacterium]